MGAAIVVVVVCLFTWTTGVNVAPTTVSKLDENKHQLAKDIMLNHPPPQAARQEDEK